MESNPQPLTTPNSDNPDEESNSSTKYGRLREEDPESDEFFRQYVLFYYQFHITEGFGIEWEKYDFFFKQCRPYDGAPPLESNRTNEELIKEETLDAIAYYNEKMGTNIVFLEHIEANFAQKSFIQNWIIFWGKDMSTLFPEPKIYQAHTERPSGTYTVHIFREKPTNEEMAASPIDVDPPQDYQIGPSKAYVSFGYAHPRFLGPGVYAVSGTPFSFRRNPPIRPRKRIPIPNGYKFVNDD